MKNNYKHFWSKMPIDPKRSVAAIASARVMGTLFFFIGAFAGCGCTVLGAKPWDHDLLAERGMQVGGYPLEAGMDNHIYFSKEASSGGRSFAGGGCGCN